MLYFLLWVVLFSLYLCAYSILFVYVILLDWPPLEIIQRLVRIIDLSLSVLSPYALRIVVPPRCILFLLVDSSAEDAVHVLFMCCRFFVLFVGFVLVFVNLFKKIIRFDGCRYLQREIQIAAIAIERLLHSLSLYA